MVGFTDSDGKYRETAFRKTFDEGMFILDEIEPCKKYYIIDGLKSVGMPFYRNTLIQANQNHKIGRWQNVDFAGYYLGTIEGYDYSMVNFASGNFSATRYFGNEGGEYESYPLYVGYAGGERVVPEWVDTVIRLFVNDFPEYADILADKMKGRHTLR